MNTLFLLVCNGLLTTSTYLLIGLGFFFVFSTRGFFDLSYGVLVPIGGYSVLVASGAGLPLWSSIAGAMIVTSLVALALDNGVFRPFRTRQSGALTLLVISLGVMTVLQSLLALVFTSRFQFLPGAFGGAGIRIVAGVHLSAVQLTSVLVAAGLAFGIGCALRWTSFGKRFRAVRDDSQLAKGVGIDTERVTTIAVLIAGAVAGASGVLIGMDVGIDPTTGLSTLLKGVTAVLLGGAGSIRGIVGGALAIGLIEQCSVWVLPGAWKEAAVFMILLLALNRHRSMRPSIFV